MKITALRTAVILGLATIGVAQTCAGNCQQKASTLEFPSDRTMGVLFTHPRCDTGAEGFRWHESSEWEQLGNAQGAVEIPANVLVRLDVEAAVIDDLSPLLSLPADSIDYLRFAYDTDLSSQFKTIGELTGLRALSFRSGQLTDDCIADLAGLTKLEHLECMAKKGTGFTDRGLKVIGQFYNLQTLDIQGNRITDAGIASLAACNSLEVLGLFETPVTGTGLDRLAMLPRLKSLSFGVYDYEADSAPVNDDGLVAIGQLTNLTILELSNTRISDDGLLHLQGLQELEQLTIHHTNVTDAGLANLEGLSSLKALRFYRDRGYLGDAAVESLAGLPLEEIRCNWYLSGEGIRQLPKLKHLKKIGLNRVVDDDLQWIAKMESLEQLDLSGPGITNRGLEQLTFLKQLKFLSVQMSDVTPACIRTIGKLSGLTRLTIGFNGDDQYGLQWPDMECWNELGNLALLESLSIRGLLLSHEHWSAISRLKNLNRLSINAPMVLTSSFFDAIQDLEQLRTLHVQEVIATHSDLEKLANLKQLERLTLHGEIDDGGLSILAKLPALRYLRIASDALTDEGIDQFKTRSTSLRNVTRIKYPKFAKSMSLNKDGIIKFHDRDNLEDLNRMLGNPAPTLSVEAVANDPSGGGIDLTRYKGDVVLVDFWSGNLDRSEHIRNIHKRYRNRGLKVVGIQSTRNGQLMAKLITSHKIPWLCGLDKDDTTAAAWHTNRHRGIYLLDRAGNVRMANIYAGDIERALEIVFAEDK